MGDLILMGVIALVAAGAVLAGAQVFAGGASDQAMKRAKAMAGAKPARTRTKAQADPAQARRKAVQETLAELEKKQSETRKRMTLRAQIAQAGLEMDERRFLMLSAGLGAVAFVLALAFGQPLLLAVAIGFSAGFGLPRWVLGFMIGSRQKRFTEEFVNAIDIIVRGVKAGLPVNECLRICANETVPIVGNEFRTLVEGLKVGVTMDDGLKRMYERMPTAEVNFFMIVMAIQQRTGGNLSEALGNLATVLRDRKRLKGKIQAMSSEAKASAMIIGSLPFCVGFIVFLTTPDYISLLFSDPMGNVMLAVPVVWMGLGIVVMKKMIDFKF